MVYLSNIFSIIFSLVFQFIIKDILCNNNNNYKVITIDPIEIIKANNNKLLSTINNSYNIIINNNYYLNKSQLKNSTNITQEDYLNNNEINTQKSDNYELNKHPFIFNDKIYPNVLFKKNNIVDYFSNFISTIEENNKDESKNSTKYKEYVFNYIDGNKISCNIPLIKKSTKKISTLKNATYLSKEIGLLLLNEIDELCFNTNLDKWYYRICPFNNAHKQLINSKIADNGTSYTEIINLGSNIELNTSSLNNTFNDSINNEHNFIKDFTDISTKNNRRKYLINYFNNNTITNSKYYDQYFNDSYIYINKRIAKIYNNDAYFKFINNNETELYLNSTLGHILNEMLNPNNKDVSAVFGIKDTHDYNYLKNMLENSNINKLNIYYQLYCFPILTMNKNFLINKESRINIIKLNKQYFVDKNKILEVRFIETIQSNLLNVNIENIDEILNYPISLKREIIKKLGSNIIVLNKQLPYSNLLTKDFYIIPSKPKNKSVHSMYQLSISKNIVHCSLCEFINYYSVNDYLIIFNNKAVRLGSNKAIDEYLEKTYKNNQTPKLFQIRKIKAIYDNSLLEVDKDFDIHFQGIISKVNYFVISFREYAKLIINNKIKQIINNQNNFFINNNTIECSSNSNKCSNKSNYNDKNTNIKKNNSIYFNDNFINYYKYLDNFEFDVELGSGALSIIKNKGNGYYSKLVDEINYTNNTYILRNNLIKNQFLFHSNLNKAITVNSEMFCAIDKVYNNTFLTFTSNCNTDEENNIYNTNLEYTNQIEYNSLKLFYIVKIKDNNNYEDDFVFNNTYPKELNYFKDNTKYYRNFYHYNYNIKDNKNLINQSDYYKFFNKDIPIYDFETPSEIKLTMLDNYIQPNNTVYYNNGFKIYNNITFLKFDLEKVQQDLSVCSIVLSNNYYLPVGVITIDSKNGIIIRDVNLINKDSMYFVNEYNPKLFNNKNTDYYETMDRSLYSNKGSFSIYYYNRNIYIGIKDNFGYERLKLNFKLSTDAYYIGIDLYNTQNVVMYNIVKANYLPSILNFLVNEYSIKTNIPDNSVYIEHFENGDYCEEEDTNRSVTVEYKCNLNNFDEAHISKVIVDKCKYKYYVESYLLCNPKSIKLNNSIKKNNRNKKIDINCNFNN